MPGIEVTDRADGYTQIVFSQSWLNTMLGECSEAARLELVGEIDNGPTDATAIGTAVHAGAEAMLNGMTFPNAHKAAVKAWKAELADPLFRWVQVKTEETALAQIAMAFTTWAEQVYPQLGTPLGVELPYKFFLCEGGGLDAPWVAYLAGCIDFIDESGVWDWKTAGDDRKYKAGFGGEGWKLKRWSVQANAYTLAAKEIGLWPGETVPFTYAAITKGKPEVQYLSLERGADDWSWLREQVRSVVPMILADLPTWPLNDQSALCSPKWCRAWDKCKGAFLGPDPW